ncbi:unnamed protein product [Phytophthora lilii]|uniref:Unnamed protein product n=1 Tax=Phytophthora lilii TaxID=2077276 RepID=A0A9W6UC79_9STRA|nr:unnamed protein product [Phytophthora lilii]
MRRLLSENETTCAVNLLNDDVRVLIYVGDADTVCNWAGNKAWVDALDWKCKDAFNTAEENSFAAQDLLNPTAALTDAGLVRAFDNLALVGISNAGHMVPTHQPAVSLDLINSALAPNGSFVCGVSNNTAGYIKLANKEDDHYFYWFYQSRSNPETDPLVLWLTGWPGSSSMFALLSENKPCSIRPDLSTTFNAYAWNSNANVIWLEQPTGVGFSFGAPADKDYNETNVGENIYWYLQGFLQTYPQYQGREFFVTGERYGGYYVPAAAHYIWSMNKASQLDDKNPIINLQGMAIGNGLTNPVIQASIN